MTTNNSATGGYLLPAAPTPLPGNLTLQQFLQTVFVGISGLDPTLVVPKWQENPPQWPDSTVSWMAFGLSEEDSDTFAYNSLDGAGNNVFMRMESLTIQCSFYGPNALENGRILRDGFQIGQNREALQSANMDFVSTSRMTRAPDLINERWINRWEMTVSLRAETLRVYPILTFLSAIGTLYSLAGTVTTIPLNTENVRE